MKAKAKNKTKETLKTLALTFCVTYIIAQKFVIYSINPVGKLLLLVGMVAMGLWFTFEPENGLGLHKANYLCMVLAGMIMAA